MQVLVDSSYFQHHDDQLQVDSKLLVLPQKLIERICNHFFPRFQVETTVVFQVPP